MRQAFATAVLLGLLFVPEQVNADSSLRDRCVDQENAQRIEDCSEALADPALSDGEKAHLLVHRAWAHYDRAEYQEALDDFTAAADHASVTDRIMGSLTAPILGDERVDRTTPFGHAFLGKAWTESVLGRYDDAMGDAKRAADWFRSAARDSDAYDAMAWAKRSIGNAAEAESYYRQSLATFPDNANTQFGFATFLFDLDRDDEAMTLLRRSNAIDNSYGYKAIWIYIHAPDREHEGKRELQRFLDATDNGPTSPTPIVRYYLGYIDADWLRDEGKKASTPLKRRENLCEIEYYIAEGLRLAGKNDEARVHYQAAVDTGVTWFIEYQSAQHRLAGH